MRKNNSNASCELWTIDEVIKLTKVKGNRFSSLTENDDVIEKEKKDHIKRVNDIKKSIINYGYLETCPMIIVDNGDGTFGAQDCQGRRDALISLVAENVIDPSIEIPVYIVKVEKERAETALRQQNSCVHKWTSVDAFAQLCENEDKMDEYEFIKNKMNEYNLPSFACMLFVYGATASHMSKMTKVPRRRNEERYEQCFKSYKRLVDHYSQVEEKPITGGVQGSGWCEILDGLVVVANAVATQKASLEYIMTAVEDALIAKVATNDRFKTLLTRTSGVKGRKEEKRDFIKLIHNKLPRNKVFAEFVKKFCEINEVSIK